MDRTVLITGATRGLGLALARRFLAAGDRVIGVSRTRERWKEVLRASPHARRFHLYRADLSSEKQILSLVREMTRRGWTPDILINNAGDGSRLARIEDIKPKEFEKTLAVNLTASFLLCKAWIPAMRKRKKGLILNVSSMAGVRAVPQLFAYSAAKFGMMALSQCVAKENADAGITCVTICPGGMNTEMRESLFGAEDAARQQSPDFVADLMLKVVSREIPLQSGSALVIRHSHIWSVEPPPAA